MAITELHLTADTDTWTGASTTALLAARAAVRGVVVSAGSSDVIDRLRKGGVEVVSCPMSGFLASLNLSRVLRHIDGDEFQLFIHSPKLTETVSGALRLVGRKERMTLMPGRPMPEFPRVDVEHPAADAEPLIMWLGNITPDSGLKDLIEQLGARADRPWRLRVVGQGKGRVVAPILNRAKALGINERIEWAGYSSNPYKQMNGVSAAIVKDMESVVAREFAAASVPTYTNLSDIL